MVRLNPKAPAFIRRGPRDDPLNRAMTRTAKSTTNDTIIRIAMQEEDSEKD